ncbi:MAG TPA: hypothetical protein VFK02_02195 [Kofleriaceae bacterium]|nr:hypothetical protein [Kofleriaceae bacterium]
MEACELVAVELRIDQIEAELDRELVPHMRAFARAYARGTALPPAPEVVHPPETLEAARAALAHPVLADRGLALVRLVAPIAIESDARVVAARAAEPTWDALAELARARDAAAGALFGHRAIDVVHRLHGADARDAGSSGAPGPLPPPVAGWAEPDGVALDGPAISHAWDAIRVRHGVSGAVRFERSASARPRTFVIQPRGEVVVVIPAHIATPADRFTVLHELGHVLAALALSAGIPRVIDEAAAAYLARALERPGEGATSWHSPAAGAARARRHQLARVLDQIERALPELPAIGERPAERPPWALWHDPGAQAAYLAAEALADDIEREIGSAPPPGALVEALVARREVVDRIAAAAL